jgi:hypothetical protein
MIETTSLALALEDAPDRALLTPPATPEARDE